MRRKVSLFDEQTGELFNTPLYLNSPHRQPTIYGDRWFQMAQDPLISMAQDRELRGLTTTVLLYLCGRLDFENYVLVSHQEIADCIGTTRPEATRAVNKLIEKKILIRGQKVGRSNSYRLNPAYGWKGDNKKAHEYQLELIRGGKS